MRSIAAGFAAGALLAIGSWGCAGDEEPRSLDQRALYGTDRGVFDLSLARDFEGNTLLAWTEGAIGRGEPLWMRAGDSEAHTIALPPVADESQRVFSPVLSFDGTSGRFVWYALEGYLAATVLHEVVIGGDGSFVDYHATSSPIAASWFGLAVDAFRIGPSQIVLLGVYTADLQFAAGVTTPGNPLGAVPVELLTVQDRCDLHIIGAATSKTDGIALLAHCDSLVAVRLSTETGTLVKVSDTEMPGRPGQLLHMAANDRALAVLLATDDGGLVAYMNEPPADTDVTGAVTGLFDEPTFSVEAPATEGRLFATDDRFAVVWNEGEGADRHTRAVVLRPGHGAGKPFDWPVDDADCPIHSAIADGKALSYTCLGRCQGSGCSQSWIYLGRMELGP